MSFGAPTPSGAGGPSAGPAFQAYPPAPNPTSRPRLRTVVIGGLVTTGFLLSAAVLAVEFETGLGVQVTLLAALFAALPLFVVVPLMTALESQTCPGGQGNSGEPHFAAHWHFPPDFTQSFSPLQSGGLLLSFGLSTVPLQSLSRQSQTSTAFSVRPLQTKAPLSQAQVPGLHSPSLWPHASPIAALGGGEGFAEPSIPSGPTPGSSIAPSQSLSTPSHRSGEGPTPPKQTTPPSPSHWEIPG
jgi:hypothetical protein